MTCPLCQNVETRFYHKDRRRDYYYCNVCKLIFVPPEFHLSREVEKERYLLHNNSPDDKPYVQFLNTFMVPFLKRVSPGAAGLDYGSGPNPVLASLLREQGLSVDIYDPYFSERDLESCSPYDFITCVETAEHFYFPDKDWKFMMTRIKPGGWLGIKTEMPGPESEFSTWHYRGDPTHVSFYSKETFAWIANLYSAKVEFEKGAGIFFQIGMG
jgi:methyltransferase family protein